MRWGTGTGTAQSWKITSLFLYFYDGKMAFSLCLYYFYLISMFGDSVIFRFYLNNTKISDMTWKKVSCKCEKNQGFSRCKEDPDFMKQKELDKKIL